jgi:DNA (cytosine-5)-methyltransferase 1
MRRTPLTVGSLFSGIGGFDLGFERAGFAIKWQVEIDPFCRAVLAKHWPDVRRYDDVRQVMGYAERDGRRERRPGRFTRNGARLSDGAQRDACERLEPVDVICGGFPCQPHSLAGRRAGADDDRDLWPEFIRLIRELRPRWVVAENVPGLLSTDAGRFFGTVLGDLAASGYDAEWDCLPASAFGAPHRRDRVWIIAYTSNERRIQSAQSRREQGQGQWFGNNGAMADADDSGCVEQCRIFTVRPQQFASQCGGWWESEPNVGRVAHGVPARVDRLRALGNAIVPQIAEWIARRILEVDDESSGSLMTTTAEPRTQLVYLEPPDRATLDADRAELITRAQLELPAEIISPQEYQAVADLEARIGAFIDRVGPLFDTHCKAAHQVWQQATRIRAVFLDGPIALKKRARDLLAAYKAKEDRIRRDEERRIAEEQRRIDLDRQKAEAKLLEQSGQVELAKAIRAQPVEAVAVSLPSVVPDVSGLSFRTDWYWEPVGGDTPGNRARSLALIVRPEYLQFVEWNDAALTAFAKRTKGTVRIPGIRFASREVPIRR